MRTQHYSETKTWTSPLLKYENGGFHVLKKPSNANSTSSWLLRPIVLAGLSSAMNAYVKATVLSKKKRRRRRSIYVSWSTKGDGLPSLKLTWTFPSNHLSLDAMAVHLFPLKWVCPPGITCRKLEPSLYLRGVLGWVFLNLLFLTIENLVGA